MKLLLIAFLSAIILVGCSSTSDIRADFNGDNSIRERKIESFTLNNVGDTIEKIIETITFNSSGTVLEFIQSSGSTEHHYDGETYSVTNYSSISDTNFTPIAYQKQYNFNLHNYISEITWNMGDDASLQKTTFCYNSRLLPTEIKSVSEINGKEFFTKLSYVYLADSVLASVIEDKKSALQDSIYHLRTSYEIDEQSNPISMSVKNIVTGETNRETDSAFIPALKDLEYTKPLTTEVFTSLFIDPLYNSDFSLVNSEIDDKGNIASAQFTKVNTLGNVEIHQNKVSYKYW